jgi:hypothetical protein
MDFTYPPHHNHGMLERLVELLAVNIHIFVWVLPRGSWKYQHAGLTVMHLLVGKYPINGGWSAKIILATDGISSHSNDWRFLYWSSYLNPAGYIYILYIVIIIITSIIIIIITSIIIIITSIIIIIIYIYIIYIYILAHRTPRIGSLDPSGFAALRVE